MPNGLVGNKLQSEVTEEFSRRRIELTLGNTGWFSGTMYAESFVQERPEVVSKITISDHTLRRSKEPPSIHIRRISGLEHQSI